LFVGLVAILFVQMAPRAKFFTVLALAALVLLSGSRSGAIAVAVFVAYAIFHSRVNAFIRYMMLLTVPILAYVIGTIFAERAESAGGIDRLNFLAVFLAE